MKPAKASGYNLLAQKLFRTLWAANLLHALGTVMLLLGISWVMTSLTTNVLLVSMVQTMASLPYLFFGIPAGVAADSLGYRRLMVVAQVWLLVMTAVLAVIALPGWWELRPVPLLVMMFLIGAGVVLHQSAWKPFLHEMAPSGQLVAAISMNSLTNRIAQLLGPILGGYLMGLAGIAALLFTRALSHVVMLFALRSIPRQAGAARTGERMRVMESVRDGWRAVVGSPRLYGPMIRCVALMVPCGAVLALLPLEAKENIQTGVIGYGGLLAALGLGTTMGVSVMPLLQRRIRLNTLSIFCIVGVASAAIAISQWDSMLLDACFLVVLGLGWSLLSVAHQFAVQVAAPPEMRGLATAFYTMTLQGSIAVGSFGFGLAAAQFGVSRGILIAGFVALAGLFLVRLYPIPDRDGELFTG